LEKQFQKISDFEIIEIDKVKGLVLLEDREIGLQASVPVGKKKLINAEVVGPYELRISYEDGSHQLKRILK
jgi:hypothetical protein